jgi:hypothetical protein
MAAMRTPRRLRQRDQAQHVLRLPLVAEEQGQVLVAAEAQVAVQCLVGIEEGRGHARAVEGAHQLLADGCVLAHPREDQLAAAQHCGGNGADDGDEAAVQALGGGLQGHGLQLQAVPRLFQQGLLVHLHHLLFASAGIVDQSYGQGPVAAEHTPAGGVVEAKCICEHC